MFKEWDRGEPLTEDERKAVEEEVNKCYYEELKEENEKLKEQVEAVTRRAEEEVKKRVKAEEVAKREKEMVDNLMNILLKRSSVVTEASEEEKSPFKCRMSNVKWAIEMNGSIFTFVFHLHSN